MKARMIPLATALALCLSLLPVGAGAAGETDITTSGLTITAQDTKAGSYVTSNGGSVVVSANGSDAVTITMTDAVLNAPLQVTGLDATLVLTGENTITGQQTTQALLSATGNLNITGDGSLHTESTSSEASPPAAIQSEKLLSISASTITVEATGTCLWGIEGITIDGGTVTANSTDSNSLYTQSELTICNQAKVTGESYFPVLATEGVEINNSSVSSTSTGDYGLWTEGALTVQNGSIVSMEGYRDGIGAVGELSIADSQVEAISEVGNGMWSNEGISIRGETTVVTAQTTAEPYGFEYDPDNAPGELAYYEYPAIVTNGSATITGGTISAIATKTSGMRVSGDMEISGETTEVTVSNEAADYPGIDVNGCFTVKGGQTTVNAPQNIGINAQGSVKIQGGSLRVSSEKVGIYAPTASVEVSGGSLTAASKTEQGIQGYGVSIDGGIVTVQCGPKSNPIDLYGDTELSIQGGELIIPSDNSTDHIQVGEKSYYLVTLDGQNGQEVSCELIVKDQPLPIPTTPTKVGYSFNGWYTAPSGGEKWTEGTATKHITLYAQWTANPPSTGGGSGGSSSHTITVPKVDNGSLRVDPLRASQGRSVTITATPNDGYQLDSLLVKDAQGNPCTLTDLGEGNYSFTMPGSAVEIEAIFVPIPEAPWVNPYTDVDSEAWYYEAVAFVSAKGWMGGYGDTRFGPGAQLSRAQLAQILYNQAETPAASGSSDFSDVERGAWYHSAICWAVEQGIVGGYGDGRFGPDDPITREQLAVMLWRGADRPTPPNLLLTFPDADQASGYALDALRWAVEQGVLSGKSGGLLNPQGQATRAEAAQMLRNLFQ